MEVFDYTISKVDSVYIESKAATTDAIVNIPFTIEANKIRILNKEMKITYKLNDATQDGLYWQYWNIVPLSDERKAILLNKIKTLENFNKWTLSE